MQRAWALPSPRCTEWSSPWTRFLSSSESCQVRLETSTLVLYLICKLDNPSTDTSWWLWIYISLREEFLGTWHLTVTDATKMSLRVSKVFLLPIIEATGFFSLLSFIGPLVIRVGDRYSMRFFSDHQILLISEVRGNVMHPFLFMTEQLH